MIYIAATVEEWKEKYPGLKPYVANCSACREIIPVDRPFIENGYAGFAIRECPCGKNENKANVTVTTNEKTRSRWKKILAPWLGGGE